MRRILPGARALRIRQRERALNEQSTQTPPRSEPTGEADCGPDYGGEVGGTGGGALIGLLLHTDNVRRSWSEATQKSRCFRLACCTCEVHCYLADRAWAHCFLGRFLPKLRRCLAALAAQTAFARSGAFDLLQPVRLLAFRRRQAGIGRGFVRRGEPRFKLGNAPLGRLKALPQGPDQGVLFGVAQVVEVGKLGYSAVRIDSAVTASSTFFRRVDAGVGYPSNRSLNGDEQLHAVRPHRA